MDDEHCNEGEDKVEAYVVEPVVGVQWVYDAIIVEVPIQHVRLRKEPLLWGRRRT